jgi:hypothetical protein|nr:hypothetical protein [Neorhizobium tomejilense]
MTTEAFTKQSLTELLNVPKEMRWMDLSAHSMSLRLAIYKNGSALVVEGGDREPEALGRLGFTKFDGEWISTNVAFLPRQVVAVLTNAKVEKDKPTSEIVLNRTEQLLPEGLPSFDTKFNQRVASVVAANPDTRFTSNPSIWFAEADLGDYDVHAFGASPEAAVSALVSAWSELAAREQADVEMLSSYRDSISVNPVEMGKGYAKGIGDKGWYKDGFNGSDERFDAILDVMPTPAPRRAGPKL